VMQCVEAPQERHRMLTAMHGIVHKIKQQKGRDKAQPLLADRPSGQTHAKYRLELRPEGVRWREGESSEDEIEEPDADIAEPPPQRRELTPAPRPAQLRERHEEEAADSDDERYQPCLLACLTAASCRADAGSAPLSERRTNTRNGRSERRPEVCLAIGRDRIIRPDGRSTAGGRPVAVVGKRGT